MNKDTKEQLCIDLIISVGGKDCSNCVYCNVWGCACDECVELSMHRLTPEAEEKAKRILWLIKTLYNDNQEE